MSQDFQNDCRVCGRMMCAVVCLVIISTENDYCFDFGLGRGSTRPVLVSLKPCLNLQSRIHSDKTI